MIKNFIGVVGPISMVAALAYEGGYQVLLGITIIGVAVWAMTRRAL
jgi:predicted RecA/RadA family phage recombinase